MGADGAMQFGKERSGTDIQMSADECGENRWPRMRLDNNDLLEKI